MTTNIKSLLELAQNPKIYMACHKHKTTVGRKGIVLKCKRTNVYTNLHNLLLELEGSKHTKIRGF
jgi:hypothetical protein